MSDPYEREAAQAAIHTLQRELAMLTEQRDSAITALEKIASLDFVIPMPYRMHAVMDIAYKALNKIHP